MDLFVRGVPQPSWVFRCLLLPPPNRRTGACHTDCDPLAEPPPKVTTHASSGASGTAAGEREPMPSSGAGPAIGHAASAPSPSSSTRKALPAHFLAIAVAPFACDASEPRLCVARAALGLGTGAPHGGAGSEGAVQLAIADADARGQCDRTEGVSVKLRIVAESWLLGDEPVAGVMSGGRPDLCCVGGACDAVAVAVADGRGGRGPCKERGVQTLK